MGSQPEGDATGQGPDDEGVHPPQAVGPLRSRYTPGLREDALTDAPTERDDEGALARLRRRKVVQWGLAYAAAAWALLQVIGFAVDAFHWPDVIKQFSMLALGSASPLRLRWPGTTATAASRA